MRFSLRSVLIAFVYVAVGSVALVRVTEVWVSAVVSLTVATLLLATAACISSTGHTRTFCGSFALTGFLYLALIYAPGSSENVAPHLATTQLLKWVAEQKYGEKVDTGQTSFSTGSLRFTGVTVRVIGTNSIWPATQFVRVGQYLTALVIGVVAASVASACSRRASRGTPSE